MPDISQYCDRPVVGLRKTENYCDKAYLEASGWKQAYGSDTTYNKFGDFVHLMVDDQTFNSSFYYRDEAIRRINLTDFYRKPKLLVARKIAASLSVLDQLAVAVDEDELGEG
jgi:hypothetical protein